MFARLAALPLVSEAVTSEIEANCGRSVQAEMQTALVGLAQVEAITAASEPLATILHAAQVLSRMRTAEQGASPASRRMLHELVALLQDLTRHRDSAVAARALQGLEQLPTSASPAADPGTPPVPWTVRIARVSAALQWLDSPQAVELRPPSACAGCSEALRVRMMSFCGLQNNARRLSRADSAAPSAHEQYFSSGPGLLVHHLELDPAQPEHDMAALPAAESLPRLRTESDAESVEGGTESTVHQIIASLRSVVGMLWWGGEQWIPGPVGGLDYLRTALQLEYPQAKRVWVATHSSVARRAVRAAQRRAEHLAEALLFRLTSRNLWAGIAARTVCCVACCHGCWCRARGRRHALWRVRSSWRAEPALHARLDGAELLDTMVIPCTEDGTVSKRNFVLYSNPNGVTYEQLARFADIIGTVHAAGLHFVSWNYRGYGLSDGWPSPANVARDVVAVHDALCRHADVGPWLGQCVAQGESVGGVAAAALMRAGRTIAGVGDRTMSSIPRVAMSMVGAWSYKPLPWVVPAWAVLNTAAWLDAEQQARVLIVDAIEDAVIPWEASLTADVGAVLGAAALGARASSLQAQAAAFVQAVHVAQPRVPCTSYLTISARAQLVFKCSDSALAAQGGGHSSASKLSSKLCPPSPDQRPLRRRPALFRAAASSSSAGASASSPEPDAGSCCSSAAVPAPASSGCATCSSLHREHTLQAAADLDAWATTLWAALHRVALAVAPSITAPYECSQLPPFAEPHSPCLLGTSLVQMRDDFDPESIAALCSPAPAPGRTEALRAARGFRSGAEAWLAWASREKLTEVPHMCGADGLRWFARGVPTSSTFMRVVRVTMRQAVLTMKQFHDAPELASALARIMPLDESDVPFQAVAALVQALGMTAALRSPVHQWLLTAAGTGGAHGLAVWLATCITWSADMGEGLDPAITAWREAEVLIAGVLGVEPVLDSSPDILACVQQLQVPEAPAVEQGSDAGRVPRLEALHSLYAAAQLCRASLDWAQRAVTQVDMAPTLRKLAGTLVRSSGGHSAPWTSEVRNTVLHSLQRVV